MTDSDNPLELEQRVYLERVRIFFQHARGNHYRAIVGAAIVTFTLHYGGVPLMSILIWLTGYTLAVIAITVVEVGFPKDIVDLGKAASWANARTALVAVLGMLFGGSSLLLPSQGAIVSELVLFLVVMGVATMTNMGYSTMPRFGLSVNLPATGLLAISLLRGGDQIHYVLAAVAVIGLVVLMTKSLDISRSAIEAIRVNERLKDEVKRRREAERDAERANTAKSDFLTAMSHELRTPMNAVIGFSEALEVGIAGELSEKQTEYVGDIHDSAQHLLALINNLLDLSKIEAGMLEIFDENFDLPGEIDRCLPMVKKQAERGEVALGVEFPAEMPALRADRRLVNQMILNLLSNAVKFTPPGGSVSVAAANGPDGGINVSVTDTGAGMSPEDIPTALLPFGQTESSRAKEGTGLGLPLVKKMAELHGGDLVIESALGEGTTATITFPPERAVA